MEETKKEKKKEKGYFGMLLELYLVFCKIGATTFGGGYAMLPILQDEIVEKRNWATDEELMDYYAIGQCTPGIIAVNTATFIGYKYCGILGGIIATLGVVSPCIVIITVIALCLKNFADLPVVKHAFNGIRACVVVLILDSVVKLGKKSIIDWRCWIIFLVILAVSLFTSVSPILLVLLAGLAGFLVMPRKKPEETEAVKAKTEEKEKKGDK